MRLAAVLLGVALLGGGSACGEGSVSSDEPGQLTRVVLEPTGKSTSEQLDRSAEIMRARLHDLGVSEPSVEPREGTIELIVPGKGEREIRVVTRRGLLELFD